MKQFFLILLLFLTIGTQAQSLKDIQSIASGLLASEVVKSPDDEMNYSGLIVVVLRLNNQVPEADIIDITPEDGDALAAAYFPYNEKYSVCCYIIKRSRAASPANIAREALNKLSNPPCNSTSTESSKIKHHKGWVHPAMR